MTAIDPRLIECLEDRATAFRRIDADYVAWNDSQDDATDDSELSPVYYSEMGFRAVAIEAVARAFCLCCANQIGIHDNREYVDLTSVSGSQSQIIRNARALADTIIGSATDVPEAARAVAIRAAVKMALIADGGRLGWQNQEGNL